MGGVTVYVNASHPTGLPEREYAKLDAQAKKSGGWRVMRRDARVFVRGRIRHSDHKTIVLRGWHEVLMNTENQSLAMRHVAFLD
jgi:hypothetical protein